MTTPHNAVHREKLLADLRAVLADAESLLQATAGQAGEGVQELRHRMSLSLSNAKYDLLELQDSVVAKAKASAQVADEFVHDHPWKSVGLAAGLGMLAGLLIGRR